MSFQYATVETFIVFSFDLLNESLGQQNSRPWKLRTPDKMMRLTRKSLKVKYSAKIGNPINGNRNRSSINGYRNHQEYEEFTHNQCVVLNNKKIVTGHLLDDQWLTIKPQNINLINKVRKGKRSWDKKKASTPSGRCNSFTKISAKYLPIPNNCHNQWKVLWIWLSRHDNNESSSKYLWSLHKNNASCFIVYIESTS